MHHHSALSAWKKLAQYVAQGSEAVEFSIAALLISDAVDFFVHLGRDRQGRRAVTEICEVAGWNGTEVQLNRVFVPGPDGRGVPQPHLSDARRTKLRDARLRRPPPPRTRRVVGVSRRRCSARCSVPPSASACCIVVAGWSGSSTDPPCRRAGTRPNVDRLLARAGLALVGAALVYWWTTGWVVAAVAVGVLGWLAPSFARAARQPAAPAGPLRGDRHLGRDAARPARVQRRPARGDRQVGSRRPAGHPRRGARPVRAGPAR